MADMTNANAVLADRYIPLGTHKLNGQTTAVWFIDTKTNILHYANTDETLNRFSLVSKPIPQQA